MFEVGVIQATFTDFAAFKAVLGRLREVGEHKYTAYGPTNLKELQDLMPSKSSPVRPIATTGAIIGLITFWAMCAFTSLIYSLVLGGKPPVSNVPYVIPAYEGTILVGSIFAFIAGLFFAALGPHKPPENYDLRFSGNLYGIDVYCKESDKEDVCKLLKDAGAEEVVDRR